MPLLSDSIRKQITKTIFSLFLLVCSVSIYPKGTDSLLVTANQILIDLLRQESISSENIIISGNELKTLPASESLISVYEEIINKSIAFKAWQGINSGINNTKNGFPYIYYNFCNLLLTELQPRFMKLFSVSKKRKILFFTAPGSCECTINSSKSKLAEVIEFYIHNNEKYDLIIEDTRNTSSFRKKYKTGFIPSTLLLDEDNTVIRRLSFDQEMILGD
jgi:hypothetical protein